MSSSGKTVCVTGASGFIGSHLVRELLQNGYKVHATVTKKTEAKTKFLQSLPNADQNLTIFEANLMSDGCFCEPFKDCEGVFHVASPTYFEAQDPENELVKPARDGTINVLKCCDKVDSVRRVILTSDMVTCSQTTPLKTQGGIITEDTWSDEGFLRKQKKWYHLSKFLSEKAAWEFMKSGSHSFDLISVVPSLVIGPMLQPEMNFSNNYILQYLNGTRQDVPAKPAFITDVRDAALVHLRLYEKGRKEGTGGGISGRFICNGNCCVWKDVCDSLRKIAPGADVPTRMVHTEERTPPELDVSGKKLSNTIDTKFRSLGETLEDTLQSFVEHRIIPSERLRKHA